MDIPQYARGNQDFWTPKLVRQVLVDAFVVTELTAGRVGPQAVTGAWPAYAREFMTKEELGFQEIQARTERPRHRRITSRDIQRAEFVMYGGKVPTGGEMKPWLAGPMSSYPELRVKLAIWCINEMRKELGRKHSSTKAICARRKWAYSTFNYHRDKAAGMIAMRLNRAEVPV
jgi:hypothetical protein